VARRSAQNDRYKKDANIGSTRKSAASAKPKRPQAESGTSGTPAKSDRAKPKKPTRTLLPNPDTAEFRRWNILNYALLGLALAFAFVVLVWGRRLEKTPFYYVMWAGWGASLAGSMYIQIVKLRKLRQEWVDSGQAAAKAKADDKERAEKAAAKEAAKAVKDADKD
jgi:uncharacterized membrane protein YcjF (UPF0283 family)